MDIVTVNYILLLVSWGLSLTAVTKTHWKYIWWCTVNHKLEWVSTALAMVVSAGLCQAGWYFVPVLGGTLVLQGFAFSEAYAALSKEEDAAMLEEMAKKGEDDHVDK